MIKYLKIRYKFLLMALLGVTAIILMSLLAQNILENGLERVKDVFKDSQKVQNIQQDFIIPLFKLREATLSLVVAPDGKYKRDIASSLTPMVEALDYSFGTTKGNLKIIWENYKSLFLLEMGIKIIKDLSM